MNLIKLLAIISITLISCQDYDKWIVSAEIPSQYFGRYHRINHFEKVHLEITKTGIYDRTSSRQANELLNTVPEIIYLQEHWNKKINNQSLKLCIDSLCEEYEIIHFRKKDGILIITNCYTYYDGKSKCGKIQEYQKVK